MSQVLVELLYGKHAHTDPRICIDVPVQTAAARAASLPHSIWQLVWHVNYWMEHELRRIAGTPAAYPEHAALSWPAVETPDAATWQQEITRFAEFLGRLADHAEASAEELTRPIPATERSEAEHASSLEAVLWQTAVHNSYHVGQVVILRKALGAWPPPSGSDTW